MYIPKANGGERPLSIPDIRDRVVAMAVKLVLEPIFEADLDDDSYGFRPERDAHQALEAVRESVAAGMRWFVDADVSSCFDTSRTTSCSGRWRAGWSTARCWR